jgi:glucokinase
VTARDVVGAIDIGGTHVTAGRVEVGARSVDPRSRTRLLLPATGTRSALLEQISSAAASIAGQDVRSVGVAVPGPFDYSTGVSRMEHKLRGLYGIDLRSKLCDALRLTDAAAVRFLNDADAFVLGEWWAGAARGHARAVGVTLGSGLGSAFVVDGEIVRTWPGIPADGPLHQHSFRGAPVEQAISGSAVAARYGADGVVDCESIAARAVAGERSACRVFEDLGEALAEFLTPWLRTFQPTCVVVGGSIARSWDLFAPRLTAGLAPIRTIESVTVAEQLDDAPLLGATLYVAQGQP